jgi:hypothetical protein
MSELNQNQLAQIEQSVSVEQIQFSEKLGMLKATNFIKKLLTVSEIKFLAEIKETKQYKGLKIINEVGQLLTVSTWADFCESLGKSHQHVDEEIRNLSFFGEDFLETSQRMTLGYRDLRKLRKLDDADREVIINGEAVKAEDRESLIDLIEEMSSKHSRDKEVLNKKVSDLTNDNAAKDQVIQKKDQKLNQLDETVAKLNSPAEIKKRAESEPQRLAAQALDDLNKACLTMHNDTVRFTNNINSIVDAINEHELYDIQDLLEANVVALFQQIAQTTVELGIQIDFQAMVNPAWMTIATETDLDCATDVEQ